VYQYYLGIDSLQEEIYTEGAKYRDFDLAQVREQYLDNIGTPEAKSLKANIEIDKKANRSVRKALKNLIEHLTQLEIEEVKFSKQADKLDTPKGQEELATKKKEERLDEIKKSSDPNVLFDKYEDEDLNNAARDRKNKLFKEEFSALPDPNNFADYNDFKESLNSPVIGTAKNDPAVDKALIKYYNDNTLSDEKPVIETFEDSEFEKVAEQVSQEDVTETGEPEFESELTNYDTLNDEIQESLEDKGDFMLHSQLYSMSRGETWQLRKFNKDAEGNNKKNRDQYLNWTDDVIATEDLFNNFGDPTDYTVNFEVTKPTKELHGFDTTTLDNHWIRLSIVKDGKKIYIGQLQRTSQTADKELTDTAKLAQLRLVADEALKTMQPGESKVIGTTRIVNYSPGLYNNLAKPRDVKAALTDEELENVGIGVYMGEHDELGLMRTNKLSVRNIKPVNAKPGSVYVAKKTPTGDWQWFACITKNLREMPDLVAKVRELLSPFESTDPLELQLATREEKVRTTLAQLREIVRYRVNGKLEPDFNSKIINVRAYHDENGKFSVDKFIEKHSLLDRKVQIDPKRLEDDDYVKDVVWFF